MKWLFQVYWNRVEILIFLIFNDMVEFKEAAELIISNSLSAMFSVVEVTAYNRDYFGND